MTDTKKSKTATTAKVFSDAEKDAMKERAREQKAAKAGADGEAEVLAKIAEMPGPDRDMAERIHAIVKEHAPTLTSKTWYGMPAYARDGKIVCFFQPASKFKYRYATLGFNEDAKLDDGSMWPTSWALTELTSADEKRIGALLKKSIG